MHSLKYQIFSILDGSVVPEACRAGLGTVTAPKGRKKRDTTQVVIKFCITGGHLRGGHPGIQVDNDLGTGGGTRGGARF